jgi:hypothetical protein
MIEETPTKRALFDAFATALAEKGYAGLWPYRIVSSSSGWKRLSGHGRIRGRASDLKARLDL